MPNLDSAPTKRRRPRRKQRGLTLIELLVVITILGIIAGIVGVAVVGQLQGAQEDTTRVQIAELAKSLDLYKVKFNRYPTTQEGLNILVSPPEGKKPLIEKLPKDPWGADFIYVSPGQHNQGKYDLQSKGSDGQADTEDDITNWK